ncbi:hypothetical protein EA658_18630 [Pseudoxanthomonas winnipegensis]|jgi:hypothetical protein|uniref:Pesticin C-terminal domain-containing protein n=2 Tax=Pseudoxanthomonas winnipegensis TaxID=2480810 RepID=A0ABY1WA12_9GAMM|nr:hypothetical protein EA659_12615 [Pseudoxanthomonas winnipegensis]TAA17058.1 hypothetical protein EA658_18630 [Pseudoxanthomonas winnipegensis]TAH71953.1 hypothetical protein EA657_12610 [Pseudoxanthomonas winnipegensis]
MNRSRLSAAIIRGLFICALSAESQGQLAQAETPENRLAPGRRSIDNDDGASQLGTEMRPLTVEEVELIMGANTTSTVFVTTAPPGGNPGGPDGPEPGGSTPGGDGTSPADPDHCYTPLSQDIRTDSSFIFANEGGVRTTGYTLSASQFPNSGVTIGAGVDLGQQSAAGLLALDVPQSIINILNPFFSLRGNDAATAISTHGAPVLSTADATLLSNALLASTTSTVSSNFDSATSGIQFGQLPEQAQTVIIDVAYPNGPNLASSAPSFWTDVTSGNWYNAESELEHWFSNGTTNARYQSDADKLDGAIKAKALPLDSSNGQCPGT